MTEHVGSRFDPVSSKVDFPKLEEDMLDRWKKEGTFSAVDEHRAHAPIFVFYEGPPTANGSPGIHHVLSRSFKDVVLRYKTMRGYRPIRRGGWDTHGLPVELEIEKELGLSTKAQIEQFGIDKFNLRCRESVFRYVKEWEALTERVGVWLDMDSAYVTYQNSYIETAWWVFKTLWDRGFIYEGFKVTPHCPRCVTSLSSHEVALGYRDNVRDPSIFVRFPLQHKQPSDGASAAVVERLGYRGGIWETSRPALVAWTTTPWTLTANMALAISPGESYALMESTETLERVLVAKESGATLLDESWSQIDVFLGAELVGITYEPPYANQDLTSHIHRVLPADYVTTTEGTGIVHTAPAYGAEDAELGRSQGYQVLHTVDLHGIVVEGFPGAGKFVKDADRDMIADLEQRNLLFRNDTILHTYPFCWRCSTPLLYYSKACWYIQTTAVKDQMVSVNQEINWQPEHIKEGRFGEWLRNNVDWAVSRERYWGTPIPIWRCEACNETMCIGGTEELQNNATQETKSLLIGLDLHRPNIDSIELRCGRCQGIMRRVPEVADAWYDSGAMPFAQWAYPANFLGNNGNPVTLRTADDLVSSDIFPADYITEAVDQTRGWFYSLLALSTLIAGRTPYQNVIVLGLILDGNGEKMSKSKGNVVDPWQVIHDQGADALRWYLFTSAPSSQARRFSSELVGETLRRFLLTLWNTYSFFTTYANIDGFNPDDHSSFWSAEVGGPSLASPPTNELDRWIISELNELIQQVTSDFEQYIPTDAGRRIEAFVDLLSNWYVRRGRRRYWQSAGDSKDNDKTWAHVTLYSCLLTTSKLIAPLAPFVADTIYRNLKPSKAISSVHLADYPVANSKLIDDDLEKATRFAMRVASLGRAARAKTNLKVRQPLSRLLVLARPDETRYLPLIRDQVLDELNIKTLEVTNDDVLASFKLRPNLPLLGPKYGKQIEAIRYALDSADANFIVRELRSLGEVTINGFVLSEEEVLVDVREREGFAVAIDTSAGLMVGLDTDLSPDLEAEGLAREIIHRVQNVRKEAGLAIADRIIVYVYDPEQNFATRAVNAYQEYVMQETLSTSVRYEQPPTSAYTQKQDLNGVSITLGVLKTG